MISGCGIDTEERYRFEKHIREINSSDFISTVFSAAEIENFTQNDSFLAVPLAFCCKEAIFKALGNSWTTSSIDWKDIEIFFLENPSKKNYKIHLRGTAEEMLKEKGNPRIISDYEFNKDFVSFEIILFNE